ncbi:hypothetical protein Pan216_36630 [Planctomycetes bacterium Pan216]|uniref:CopG family transcriptional regulator n=1 Tax=Kolteria novifilia TaxID=2527975 RepID=A0A518B766_9BACT|nr:hypothetical protein Pan216_36630 [Planctomycetes bacterium Pan216]
MTRKAAKSTVVAFKVEDELADFLDRLPNKSEFIRRAIYSQLGVACPLCLGTGSVAKETHDRFEKFLEHWTVEECKDCGDQFPIPKNLNEASASLTRQHLEAFFDSDEHNHSLACDHGHESDTASN